VGSFWRIRHHPERAHRVRGTLATDSFATRFEPIAVNLLNNAAKYIEPRGRIAPESG
jgi:signal transduction histidine kinase